MKKRKRLPFEEAFFSGLVGGRAGELFLREEGCKAINIFVSEHLTEP